MNEPEKGYPLRHIDDESAVIPNTSIAKILSLIPPGSRVLDVGCASGDLAQLLAARGSEVIGIDINATAIATAAPFCSQTFVADLDIERLPDIVGGERFDIIVFADVLEHLRDPWSVLDSARALLNDGGHAIISVPNIAHGAIRLGLLAGTFDYRQFGILDDTHLRFFTRRSVDILLIRSGYRLDAIERTTLTLFQPSELVGALDAGSVSPELLAQIRSDAEYETLQFVVRASALDDAGKMEQLSRAYAYASTAEAEVDEIRRQLVLTQQLLADKMTAANETTIASSNNNELALSLATDQLTSLFESFTALSKRFEVVQRSEETARMHATVAYHSLYQQLVQRADDYGSVARIR